MTALSAIYTALVAGVARVYLLGLLGQSLLEVGARAFYAQQDARTPLRVTAIGLTTFTVSALLFFRPLGANGIALANSIAFTLEAVILGLGLFLAATAVVAIITTAIMNRANQIQ